MRCFIFVFLVAFTQAVSAEVQSLSLPINVTTPKGQKYLRVNVKCDNSDLLPILIKRGPSSEWCSLIDSSLCSRSKMTVAMKTCQPRHLAKLRKSQQEGTQNLEGSKTEEPKKAKAVAKKSEADVEREKNELEKQRVELERQKVILLQLQAELKKLELERDTNKSN